MNLGEYTEEFIESCTIPELLSLRKDLAMFPDSESDAAWLKKVDETIRAKVTALTTKPKPPPTPNQGEVK